jgi:hypothetical protein
VVCCPVTEYCSTAQHAIKPARRGRRNYVVAQFYLTSFDC